MRPKKSKPRARARIYRATPNNLRRLAAVLRRGGLVAVPTETVYGLAAHALDAGACARIFVAKGRPTSDPLIVHVGGWRELEAIAETNAAARVLARAFWPGPLTMILPRKSMVPDIVSAGLPSVAVRMPRHALFRRLQRLAGIPLAAPSANPFGYVSPTTAQHVRDGLGDAIGHILDGGPTAIGVESTIVDIRDPQRPRLLRPGAITRAALEKVLGRRVSDGARHATPATQAQLAPGMLSRHYSPRTPVELHATIDRGRAGFADLRQAWLFFARPAGLAGKNIFALTPTGRATVAARRLFGALRALDARKFDRIHVELAPGGGLADAINDRLRRAASKR